MEINYKKLNEIIPYENNPRNNEIAIDKVANSINEFGFKVPIILDKNNVIITGHTRYLASKKLGLESVPCIIAYDLSKSQVKALRIADNKVSEYSSWDNSLLNLELEQLKEMNFNMIDFGFVDIENLRDELDFNDEDFIQDLEVIKEKKDKVIICPHCESEIKI